MKDLEVIEQFKGQISWADETELVEHGDRTFLKSNLAIYYPVRWDHVEADKPSMRVLMEFYRLRMIAIVWGEPSDKDVTRICYEMMQAGFSIPTFVDAAASLAQSDFILRACDGLDWNKTMQAIAQKGFDAKPVYEWSETA